MRKPSFFHAGVQDGHGTWIDLAIGDGLDVIPESPCEPPNAAKHIQSPHDNQCFLHGGLRVAYVLEKNARHVILIIERVGGGRAHSKPRSPGGPKIPDAGHVSLSDGNVHALFDLHRKHNDFYLTFIAASEATELNAVLENYSAITGLSMEEMNSDAERMAHFIWDYVLQHVPAPPMVKDDAAMVQQPAPEELQKAISATKRRFLEFNYPYRCSDMCCIITCRERTMFGMENLLYCDKHCGLATLYAGRHSGQEGFVFFARIAMKTC